MAINFSKHKDEEVEIKLRELSELYLVVKETILYFEEINQEQKTDIQVINELRNAFDHLMRVTSTWVDVKQPSDDPDQYILKNLDKSYGHVYRAGYDTVDFLCLTIKKEIANDLKRFHSDSIQTALPDYYSEIKPSLVELENEITKYRSKKDVTEDDHGRLIGYIKVARELGDYRKKVAIAIPSLTELKKQRDRDCKDADEKVSQVARKNWTMKAIIGVILLILGAVIHSVWVG